MGFLTSLFGGEGNMVFTVILGLGIVLVLIVLGVWLLKILFNATGKVGRGKIRRLSVIDSLPIDSKRQLVLVRRDNVDHLILIGSGHDVVVETGIEPPVEQPAAKRPRGRIASLATARTEKREQEQPARPVPVAEPRVAPVATPSSAPAPQATAQEDEPETEAEIIPETDRKPVRRMSLRHTGLLRPSATKVEPELSAESSTPESVIEQAETADSDKKDLSATASDDVAASEEVNESSDGGSQDDSSKQTEKA